MINMLRALIGEVDSMQGQMGNVSKEIEITIKKCQTDVTKLQH